MSKLAVQEYMSKLAAQEYTPKLAAPEAITVHCLHKRRPFNKWFDQQAARRANALCELLFGLGVTRRYVRLLNICCVLWVESDAGISVGTVLVSREDEGECATYKMHALAVYREHQNRGVGTALVSAIDGALPKGATLWLCVDANREHTDRLVDWYHRLGFQHAYSPARFPHRHDEIVMTRVVV